MMKILITLLLLFSNSDNIFSQERIDSLYPIRIKNRWGFINPKGQIVIKPTYYQVGYFKNGIAEVIDTNEIQTYINLKEEIIYKHYEITRDIYHDFSENLLAVFDTTKQKWGYIGTNGKWKIKPKYYSVKDFHEGLAVVCENANIHSDGGFCGTKLAHPTYGVINKKGRYIVKPRFIDLSNFYKGYAFFNDTCIINTKGNIVLSSTLTDSQILDRRFVYNYSLKRKIRDEHNIETSFDDFYIQETLFTYQNRKANKCGFINRNGEIICDAIYEHTGSFFEDICAVQIEKLWGYIDKSCSLIIEPKFDKAFGFNEGYAVVCFKGKYGVINKKGEFIIEPKYDLEYKYGTSKCVHHNFVTFINDGKSVLLNMKNELIWEEK